MHTLMTLLLLLPPSSVAGSAAKQSEGAQASLQLMQMDLRFAMASAADGLEGWMSFFAEDASIFPPGNPIITGIDEIRAFYEKAGFDPKRLSWKPVKAEVSSSGDIGYTFGYWEMKDTSPDETISSRGKYVTVWKRQADGNWKVIADIGSP